MKQNLFAIFALALGLASITACNKNDDPVIPVYDIPTSYNFKNVDYADATKAIDMWSVFTGYLGKASSQKLDQTVVNNLWNNTSTPFTADLVKDLPYTFTQLNQATNIKLSALTTEPKVIKDFADSVVKVSAFYNKDGDEGVAGKQGGNRLFNYSGLELNQAVTKGMMGSMAFYKVMENLEKSQNADNNTVVEGKGTAMQHFWDLAFGYVGIPRENYIDRSKDTIYAFSKTDINRPLAIGGYFSERGQYIGAGQKVYDAFIKGRAAIGAKDYKKRDECIAIIKEYIEKTLAAALWNYTVQPSKPGSGDVSARASRLHQLSEGYGFVVALKYRPSTSKLTSANYNEIATIMNKSFYELLRNADADRSKSDLMKVKPILEAAYGRLQDANKD